MQVRKRNGSLEDVNLDKITQSVQRCCSGLEGVDFEKIAYRTVGGLFDGVSTKELDELSIQTAVGFIAEDPVYSKVAARLLSNYVAKEVESQEIYSFSQSINAGFENGLIGEEVYDFVMNNKRKLNALIEDNRNKLFEFYGLRIVYDRYLLKHPTTRKVIETPQYFLMRVACGLVEDVKEANEFYSMLSELYCMASTPTLFNSGTAHSQMSSCFVAGTKVMTVNEGMKNIEEVVAGDLVVTHRGNVKTVTQTHRNLLSDRRLFDCKCWGTPQFTITDNHRLWSISQEQIGWEDTSPRWNSAEYLRVGDWVAIPQWEGDTNSEIIDLASMLELFSGDGNNVSYNYEVTEDTIRCTSHWTRLDYLNGDPAGIAMSKPHTEVKRFLRIDETFAQFMGIWYGDGHIQHRRNSARTQIPAGIGIAVHRENKALIEFCQKVGWEYLGVEPSINEMKNQNCISMLFSSTLVGAVFKELFGSKFSGKRLYKGCYRWSRSLFDSFLAGLVSSDGCVSKEGAVTITMANRDLIRSIYQVGRQLGLPVTYRPISHRCDSHSPQATMSVPLLNTVTSRIFKHYPDERLAEVCDKNSQSSSIKVVDGVTFVRLNSKSISTERPDFVYTLGVEDDHSYVVEGIVCENCYLLDSPIDCIEDIEKRKSDIAQLSKWAGGIGLNFSRVRGAGALIKGTNGISNGVVPFLHSLSANVASWNQGGKRKGAACVYLEPHHPDLMDFLELRDNTGDHEKRAYNLNLANWIPDLFMKRVYNDEMWSFFDPSVAPDLSDIFGEEYERRYLELEEQKLYKKQLPARVVYHRMMKTIAETGNGWINFKDSANRRCNSALVGSVVHSSNLCTEILEPTSSGQYQEWPIEQLHELHYKASHGEINCNIIGVDWDRGVVKTLMGGEVAVCNLQSINLARHVKNGKMDWDRLAKTTKTAVKYLDRVIDRNYYPIHEARASNMRWRPIGLGLMGWQDVLFQLRIPFESPEAVELSRRVSEEVYYNALKASCDLAKLHGPHRDFDKTHAAQGRLQMDLAGHSDAVSDPERWEKLRNEIRRSGLRNSLLIAIAPTVTISAISGCYECIEPQISNLFKRETLTGEFVTINKYLVEDLKGLGLWDEEMRNRIKDGDGSVQQIEEIPEEMRQLYKTAWEVKQKSIIDQMRERGWFIDQSASMNLFVENPTIEKLSSMYMYCWNGGRDVSGSVLPDGVKTCYYLRSKSATKINRTTGLKATSEPMTAENTVVEEPDLENPEICQACQ